MTMHDQNPLDDEPQQPKAPQGDDIVLINAEDTLEYLARELQNSLRRIAMLEGQRVLMQKLIDNMEGRLELVEGRPPMQTGSA